MGERLTASHLTQARLRSGLSALAVAVLVALVVGLVVGSVPLEWRSLFAPGPVRAIFFQVRLPRVLLAALVGAGLAVSGAALQPTLRNPLASPDIIGVSGGAALAAVIALVLLAIFGRPYVPRALLRLVIPHAVATTIVAPLVYRLAARTQALASGFLGRQQQQDDGKRTFDPKMATPAPARPDTEGKSP